MDIIQAITQELKVEKWQVEAAVKLIDEGNTIPFISRYRREPVASFLYREMNGMVLPSSINLTAASTCHFSTFNSCVIT